ncbi:MAG TPA: hypothetical protein DCY13_02895 [Verrucomicrobiales bacterium]|nr:hypothetical protein [Verrucomicrobiales bacterium]
MTHRVPSILSLDRWHSRSELSVRRAFWVFAAVLLAFRLTVLAVLPLDLSGDEAYYWEWGRHLDWGYFSKPPGIGWLMALAGWVGDDTTFGIRMFAVLLGTGSLAFLFLLALRLYGPAVAMITAIVFVANPANAALNLTLTIDAPLMFCWTLSLWAFWEFIQAGQASCPSRERARTDREGVKGGKTRSRGESSKAPAGAPLTGWKSVLLWGALLLFGLIGGMLSKQMMMLFHPLAILFLALSRDHRHQLRRPALWMILIGSFVALLPPLWWNIQNDWLTVKHTMHHFESGGVGIGKQIGRFFEFLASQLGIITPVFYLLLLVLVVAVLWRWKVLGDRERFLWLFGGPALLLILAMGLRQRINPNWPAVFYASTIILMTGWAAGRWSLDLKLDRWRRAFPWGLRIAVGMAVAVYVAAFLFSFGYVRAGELDPLARLRGWSRMARDVDAVRRDLPDGGELPLITQGHRYLASELAFYLAGHPRVYTFNPEPGTIRSQHDLWETPAAHLGRDCLLILAQKPDQLDPMLTNRFDSVTIHQIVRYPQEREGRQTLTIAIGRNLREWPALPN